MVSRAREFLFQANDAISLPKWFRELVSPDLWLNDAISLDIHWTIGLKSQDGFQMVSNIGPLNNAISLDIH